MRSISNQILGAVNRQVIMNSKAIRVPNYAVYHWTDGKTNRIVVELAVRLTQCASDDSDCSEHVAQEVRSLKIATS